MRCAVGGDIKYHVTRELSAISEARPAAVGRVRLNLPTVTASFTGRDEELDSLERALAAAADVVITQAIGGLGGIGKSQLAAAYVRAHVEEYEIVAWVRAEDGAIADLAQLATRLGVAAVGMAPSDRARVALAFLAECPGSWLSDAALASSTSAGIANVVPVRSANDLGSPRGGVARGFSPTRGDGRGFLDAPTS